MWAVNQNEFDNLDLIEQLLSYSNLFAIPLWTSAVLHLELHLWVLSTNSHWLNCTHVCVIYWFQFDLSSQSNWREHLKIPDMLCFDVHQTATIPWSNNSFLICSINSRWSRQFSQKQGLLVTSCLRTVVPVLTHITDRRHSQVKQRQWSPD